MFLRWGETAASKHFSAPSKIAQTTATETHMFEPKYSMNIFALTLAAVLLAVPGPCLLPLGTSILAMQFLSNIARNRPRG